MTESAVVPVPPPVEGPLPWERQPGEPDDCFNAFRYYRDMPMPRQALRASPMVGTNTLWQWCNKWSWIARASQYDDHISDLAIAEREALVKQSARDIQVQHMGILQGARELLEREVAKYLAISREAKGPSLLKPAELSKLLDSVVKLDRLVRGETTENVAPTEDLSNLSVDDLRVMRELKQKAKGA